MVRDGEYYDLTPYAEYSLTGTLPTQFLDALVDTILRWAHDDRFEDAEHFFNLALRNAPAIGERMPAAVVERYVARALADQEEDGGWPSSSYWAPVTVTSRVELS